MNQQTIMKLSNDLMEVNVKCITFKGALNMGLLNNSFNLRCMNSNADIICCGEVHPDKFIAKYLIVNESNLDNQDRNPNSKLISFIEQIVSNNKNIKK